MLQSDDSDQTALKSLPKSPVILSDSILCFGLVGASYILAKVEEIIALEADRQVCLLHLAHTPKLTANRHLGFFKPKLIQQHHFLEISKSVLINPAHLLRIQPRDRTITLTNGLSFSVSKSRQEYINQLVKHLLDHWEF
ncbi:MAG: LytTR family transcriptional regulator DNA-binding domain-containing protein [Bacteroidetes bacterium]|nr:LytTR family transcriptional regulator DNA-binding domain-containing protein [Bacteroidota bacterium]